MIIGLYKPINSVAYLHNIVSYIYYKVTKDTYNATKVHFIFQATKAFS